MTSKRYGAEFKAEAVKHVRTPIAFHGIRVERSAHTDCGCYPSTCSPRHPRKPV